MSRGTLRSALSRRSGRRRIPYRKRHRLRLVLNSAHASAAARAKHGAIGYLSSALSAILRISRLSSQPQSARVLALGANIPVALVAGVLGGILGAPIAELVASWLPKDIHGTVANVASMAITTSVVYIAMSALATSFTYAYLGALLWL